MAADNPHDLEPIEPRTAQELYLDHKANQCSDVTVQSHEYRLNYFVSWCAENGIDNMNDISGRNLHEYRLWRKEEGELNKISMQTQMSTLRVFLKYCGSIEAVGSDLYNKVLVPQVSGEEEQRDVMLEAERAEEILQNLSKYHYASREHVLFAILWETGMRIGAARSLDERDVKIEDQCLDVAHRPETGTTLKNAQGGERLVAISAEMIQSRFFRTNEADVLRLSSVLSDSPRSEEAGFRVSPPGCTLRELVSEMFTRDRESCVYELLGRLEGPRAQT